MKVSGQAAALALLCIGACVDEVEDPNDGPTGVFVPDGGGAVVTTDAAAASVDAGTGVPGSPGLTGASDAGAVGAPVDAGSASGFPRWDGGFPFGDGGFPRFDAGGATTADAGSANDAGGTSGGDAGDDPYANARQVCVDTINMYRATKNLPPLQRASASRESCSDKGAEKDGKSGVPHSSAGSCQGLGAQNACPGYPVGGFGGSATLEDAIKFCLKQMWAEGEPPEGGKECISKYFKGDTACFLAHGHYLNMIDTNNAVVSCGFYDMGNNKFWMNQDFGR